MNMADDVSVLERLRSGIIGDGRVYEHASVEVCNLQCDVKILVGGDASADGVSQDGRDHVCRGWNIAHGYGRH